MLHGYFDLPTFSFFEQNNIWTGSMFRYFSYRIMPIKRKPDDEKKSELHLYVWYGLECFDNVKSFVAEYSEDYSQEGLDAIIEKLSAEFEKYKPIRKEVENNTKFR